MAGAELFRTSFVGGYNKSDVMEYVKKLEGELEYLRTVKDKAAALEKSVSELLEQKSKEKQDSVQADKPGQEGESGQTDTVNLQSWLPKDMNEEAFTELKEKAQKYDESYDTIKKLLLDSRIEAQIILKDAEMKANKMVEDARIQAEEQSRESQIRLLADAQLKARKIIQDAEKRAEENTIEAKKTIAIEIKDSASKLQSEIKAIQASMDVLIEQLPIRLERCMEEQLLVGSTTGSSVRKEDGGDP